MPKTSRSGAPKRTSRPDPGARVRRPPGVTLATAAVALLYGVRPLVEIALWSRLDATAEEALLPGGVDITTWAWAEGVFGAVMLVLCALTWWGRPAWIRWGLIGAMLTLTAINLARIVQAWGVELDPIFGGQLQSTLRSALLCQLPMMVLVPLYVVWFLNRAPARAFFRQRANRAALDPEREARVETETVTPPPTMR